MYGHSQSRVVEHLFVDRTEDETKLLSKRDEFYRITQEWKIQYLYHEITNSSTNLLFRDLRSLSAYATFAQ